MNCFQNLLSLWYITTIYINANENQKLWIAFRIYYLCDTSQHTNLTYRWGGCCELLSEFIIFVIHHNKKIALILTHSVVNCFQNLLSLWYITTKGNEDATAGLLWIAFRIYYLCDTSQQQAILQTILSCCELLSEFIIFVIHHNFSENEML